ncbi:MAG: ribosome assembly RNA-binding protein YhbY [Spirochaetes bacterium]|nr:ribosome assembly RNA-binding protein YhbY [Spirochaetota bacterium]
MSASEKKNLKAKAHHLKPVVQIGHKGMTKALIKAIDDALIAHELIKIQFLDFKEEKRELAQEISKETGSVIVGMIGNVLILYRKNPEDE